jgi:lysophospholipase L1-like esterase
MRAKQEKLKAVCLGKPNLKTDLLVFLFCILRKHKLAVKHFLSTPCFRLGRQPGGYGLAMWYAPVLAFSLALNALAAAAAAMFVRKKGGLQFIKSKLAAKGVIRDQALERFENAYTRSRVELFALFPPGPRDIVMLGDSLTDLGPWHLLLNSTQIRNQGIAGDTAGGLLARLDTVGHPALVTLLIGINDLNHGQTPAGLLADYRRILEAIASLTPRPRVIVQALLPIDHFAWGIAVQRNIEAFNPQLQALALEMGLEWLDLHAVFRCDGQLDPACTHDGLHLNARGYQRWAEQLAPLLVNAQQPSPG